jgi:hypothetical protein
MIILEFGKFLFGFLFLFIFFTRAFNSASGTNNGIQFLVSCIRKGRGRTLMTDGWTDGRSRKGGKFDALS